MSGGKLHVEHIDCAVVVDIAGRTVGCARRAWDSYEVRLTPLSRPRVDKNKVIDIRVLDQELIEAFRPRAVTWNKHGTSLAYRAERVNRNEFHQVWSQTRAHGTIPNT